MRRIFVALATLLCLSFPAFAGSVVWQSGTLVYSGQIMPGDARLVYDALKAAQATPGVRVHMASYGGDISESLRVGRILRHYQASVTHAYCASSCVLSYLGGTRRTLNGTSMKLGLVVHQPAATAAFLNSRDPAMQAAVKELHDYVVSMTGSEAFYALMMSIPFENYRPLTQAEAYELNVATE